jgi:hypothetical protein
MVKLMAGPEGVVQPGEVLQVDDQTADELVKHHAAELVSPAVSQKTARAEETATLEAPERAIKPAAKRRQAPKK